MTRQNDSARARSSATIVPRGTSPKIRLSACCSSANVAVAPIAMIAVPIHAAHPSSSRGRPRAGHESLDQTCAVGADQAGDLHGQKMARGVETDPPAADRNHQNEKRRQ